MTPGPARLDDEELVEPVEFPSIQQVIGEE